MRPQRIWSTTALTNLLMPESVSGLPLRTVSLILVLFLLAIAPGDFLLLGWIRRRRWTWVLFPAVSLAFTGFTMWTARQHLGQTTYDRSITVIDVDQDGRPIRTSRFEMLFAPSNRQVLTEQHSSLMVPLDPGLDNLLQAPYRSNAPLTYERPWTFTGNMPRKYTVSRDVRQWSPRLARTTYFGPRDEDDAAHLPTIDWDLLDANDSRGLVAFGPVYALRVSAQGTRPLFNTSTFIPPKMIELASKITSRHPSGLFFVLSQISPTGSGNWEDLALLDASDPLQEVLVVITNPVEGQYVITRQLRVMSDES